MTINSELSNPALVEGNVFRFPTVIRPMKVAAIPAITTVIQAAVKG